MSKIVASAAPGRIAKLLAVLSVACFWLMPLSPMIAIGAVSMTKEATGWTRQLAMTGAFLCIAYTVFMALVMVRVSLQMGL